MVWTLCIEWLAFSSRVRALMAGNPDVELLGGLGVDSISAWVTARDLSWMSVASDTAVERLSLEAPNDQG